MNSPAMKTLASLFLGAALVASISFTLGFQQGPEKFATVDFQKAMIESPAGAKARQTIPARRALMENLVKYFSTYDVMTLEQAGKIRDLTLVEKPSDAEKTQLVNLQNDVKAAQASWSSLIEKKSPTKEELDTLNKLNKQRSDISDFIDKLKVDLSNQYNAYQEKKQTEVYNAVKAAVKDTATKKGYTIVLEQSAVMFSVNETTNDITADVIKNLGG
ncbi:MAG: OmpH family outer membrane protein [Armatimonadota bacterium]